MIVFREIVCDGQSGVMFWAAIQVTRDDPRRQRIFAEAKRFGPAGLILPRRQRKLRERHRKNLHCLRTTFFRHCFATRLAVSQFVLPVRISLTVIGGRLTLPQSLAHVLGGAYIHPTSTSRGRTFFTDSFLFTTFKRSGVDAPATRPGPSLVPPPGRGPGRRGCRLPPSALNLLSGQIRFLLSGSRSGAFGPVSRSR